MIIPTNKNVYLVSFGFFCLFAGYAAAQQYLVPLFALQGKTNHALGSLLTLYTAFLLANIIAPKLIQIFRLRFSLILGALGFASFIAAVALNGETLFIYLTSILAGVGSSLVWICVGEVITYSSDDKTHGSNLGFQSAAYWLGSWLGVGLGGFLLERLSLSVLYFYFLLIVFLSIPFFLLIKIQDQVSDERKINLKFLFDKRLILLFPLVFSSFFLSGLGFSAINLITLSFGLGFVGLLSTIGLGSRIVGSFSSGFLADRVSKIKLICAIITLTFLGVVLIFLTPFKIPIIFGAIFFGIAHPSVYPVSLVLLREKFSHRAYSQVIGVFFLYTGVGSIGALLTTLYLDPKISFLPGLIFLLLAVPSTYLFTKIK